MVEEVEEAGVGEVKLVERKVAHFGWGESVDDGSAAAVEKKGFITGEDVPGAERGGVDFGDKTVGGGEGSERRRRRH